MGSIVITGDVVTRADDTATSRKPKRSTVWIKDGQISAVTAPNGSVPGFEGVTRMEIPNSVILPGFIDMHNHVGYNALGLWSEESQRTPWRHNKHWTRAPSYQSDVTWPAACWATAAPEALLAYIQVRALVGGTTTQQGWPTASRRDLRALRSVDSDGGMPGWLDPIVSSVGELTGDALARRGQQVSNGIGFVYHCSEGVNEAVGDQFDAARLAGVLGPTFIGVHCCGVTAQQWAKWPKAGAGAVAWSPFSNFWLYGLTTQIPAARKRNVKVCLGSDWGPSGTKNLLGEMKVARLAADRNGPQLTPWQLTDDDLLDMVTLNPGQMLERCWRVPAGRIVAGALGDLTILHRRTQPSGWTASHAMRAREDDMALVIVNGEARFGDKVLMRAAKAVTPFEVSVGQRTCLASLPPRPPGPTGASPAWTWDSIIGELDEVAADPAGTVKRARARRNAFAGPLHSAEAPLVLTLDMPGGGPRATAGLPKDFGDVNFKPLPSLVHDQEFVDAIHGKGFHGGVLDGLGGLL